MRRAVGHSLVASVARGRRPVHGDGVPRPPPARDSAGRWHISILVEDTVRALPPTDATVGIDAGVTSLVTLSTGEKVVNPKHEKRSQASYDLRRLRTHGLITRIRGTHRYQVTDTGLHHALFLTRLHDRFLRTGLAELADPDPPASSPLRAASRAYQHALDDLTRQAHLAA